MLSVKIEYSDDENCQHDIDSAIRTIKPLYCCPWDTVEL